MGEVTVKLCKVQHLCNSKMKLNLRTQIRESNLFNNCWFGECFPAGSMDSENVSVETITVAALIEGLKLTETQAREEDPRLNMVYSPPPPPEDGWKRFDGEGKIDPSIPNTRTSVDSLALTEAWASRPASVIMQEHVVEVFENQRRTPYPPFDWSSSAYTRANFSDLNFTKNYKFDTVLSAKPPEGWNWIGKWEIDKVYTQTDMDGWSYGVTFSKLLSNFKRGKSYAKPINAYARRRKWVRKLVSTGPGMDQQQVLLSFTYIRLIIFWYL
jgi:hypothetical protein